MPPGSPTPTPRGPGGLQNWVGKHRNPGGWEVGASRSPETPGICGNPARGT